jgi:endonuclease YncB( thermonuclease family)
MPSLELQAVPQTYAELRRAVEQTLIQGQRQVEAAKVRTYWETGRLIHEHVLLFKDRADYGAKTIRRLARDLHVDHTVLHRCVGFARAFPIVAHGQQLNWAHYRLLISVQDEALRKKLAAEASDKGWTSPELATRIGRLLPAGEASSEGSGNPPPPRLLKPRCGSPGVCRVIADGDHPAIDLGFACYLRPPPTCKLAAGDFAQATATGFAPRPDATKADLFTYPAEVLKVVDGDTLWVRIFLRPDQWLKQKIRLRDLDCPELDTAEGRAAKSFTADLVARAKAVTICTTKPDKYDRYLADVFLEGDGEPVFLNNALLAAGHATVKKEWEFSDWGG